MRLTRHQIPLIQEVRGRCELVRRLPRIPPRYHSLAAVCAFSAALLLSCFGGNGPPTLADFDPQPAYHIVDPLNQGSQPDTTRQEVERRTPFSIAIPSFIPDGYEPAHVQVTLPLSKDPNAERETKVFINFINAEAQSMLQLTEFTGSSQIGSQPSEEVKVNNKAAVFIPSDQLLGLNWVLCDRSFLLEGDPPTVTKDILRKVAESVKIDCS